MRRTCGNAAKTRGPAKKRVREPQKQDHEERAVAGAHNAKRERRGGRRNKKNGQDGGRKRRGGSTRQRKEQKWADETVPEGSQMRDPSPNAEEEHADEGRRQ